MGGRVAVLVVNVNVIVRKLCSGDVHVREGEAVRV